MRARRTKRTKTRIPLTGSLSVPGDKSISHRALMIAALADGRSTLMGLNTGDDVTATADALRALGVDVVTKDNYQVEVYGRGVSGFHESPAVIDARNSGTTVRTLSGICAGIDALTVLVGDETLSRRPMLRVVAPLRQMGAHIDGRAHGELLPLAIRGGPLSGIDIELPVASAQVKTALLFAGCMAEGTTTVVEPGRSRDHTERMLASAGVPVTRASERGVVSVDGPATPSPMRLSIPGDFSSAAFLLAAALLIEDSDLVIEDVGLNPTRTGLVDVLRKMGADVELSVDRSEGGEPTGTIRARSSQLSGADPSPDTVATFIDEIPILAVVATQAEGRTEIRGASELRLKESDRIAAIVEGLTSIGAEAEAYPDGLAVTGPTPLTGGSVDCLGDHRVAMAFAIAGLIADDNVRIAGWGSIATSFPEFLDVLGRAQGRIAP